MRPHRQRLAEIIKKHPVDTYASNSYIKNKIFLLTMTFLLLCGCTTFSETYNDLGLHEEELALVKGVYSPGTFYTDYTVYFLHVYDESGNSVIGNPNINSLNQARLKEIKLQPGEYLFDTLCDRGSAYARPSITISVKANKTYLLTCEKAATKNFLGLNRLNINLSVEETDSHDLTLNPSNK